MTKFLSIDGGGIEPGGGQHTIEKNNDSKREAWLKAEGFKVLRFLEGRNW